MDLLKVLGNMIHASMQARLFDINAILGNPTKDNALDQLEESIKQYALLETQMNVIKRLSEEIDNAKQQNTDEN